MGAIGPESMPPMRPAASNIDTEEVWSASLRAKVT